MWKGRNTTFYLQFTLYFSSAHEKGEFFNLNCNAKMLKFIQSKSV
jgi:hypothetical protein